MLSRFRPSPAMIVACLALIVALGGTSYAVTQLRTGSVGSKQLKNNAVTSPKIKNGTITGADVNKANLGKVPLAATADNAGLLNNLASTDFLRSNGKAVDASHADNATNATNADTAGNANAVNGSQVRKFFFRGNAATTLQKDLVTLGGFTLAARCNANAPELVVVSSVDNWDLGGYRNDGGTFVGLFGFSAVANTPSALTTTNTKGGSVTLVNPAGNVVTVVFASNSNSTLDNANCEVSGVASGG